MRLYECFAENGFHTTLITTFGIDFDAYENIVLGRLRGSGCHNNILISDSGMLTYALEGASSPPLSAGRLYSVTGARAAGVFHPKLVLQLGRNRGRLIVSSANMTAPGLAGNLEIAGTLECKAADSAERRLVAAAWQYLARLFEPDHQAISQQLAWMRPRTSWLFDTEPAGNILPLSDGSLAAFLGASQTQGIGSRFAGLVAGEAVRRLIVISPYWDDRLEALRFLSDRLAPESIVIPIEPCRALFPGQMLDALPQARLLDLGPFSETRFVHAKTIIAQTDSADHVLFGSANCTVAALGTEEFPGHNEEACLYRRLPPQAAIASLRLDKIFAEAPAIQPAALPLPRETDDLPLGEMAQRFAGRFECMFDTLLWWPPETGTAEQAGIELLHRNGLLLHCTVDPLPRGTGGALRFRIAGTSERPAFARLRFADGTFSARAIVTLMDALNEAAREPNSRKVEIAVHQLDGETEEGLWLMEVIDELEAAEAAQAGDDPIKRKRSEQADARADEPASRTLPYEAFIAGRRLRSEEAAIHRSSLAGSEMSVVRAFLNRILAVGSPTDETTASETASAIEHAFDLGDEVTDGEQALEAGAEFPATEARTSPEDAARRQAARRRANREQILSAVETFNDRIRNRAGSGALNPFDALRLRAMLMIVAASGWHGAEFGTTAKQHDRQRTSLQVLPVAGTVDSWPRTIGRILFAFFGGSDPAIRHLEIDSRFDQLTDDLVECWITCIWAAQACMSPIRHEPDLGCLLPSMTKLTTQIYGLTGLDPEELLSGDVHAVFAALNGRFAGRLGLDPAKLESAHLAAVATIREREPALA
jgi:hypothetical protein